MARKILVLLDGGQELKKSLPAIERIVSRGMRMVFMFRYPVESFRWKLAELENNFSPKLFRQPFFLPALILQPGPTVGR